VDENGRSSSAGDKANGVEAAGLARWANGSVTEHAWSRAAATADSVPGPDAPPNGYPADHRPIDDDDTAQWLAPGLSDDTPAGGMPAVEPPVWREAARYAASSAPPVPANPPYRGNGVYGLPLSAERHAPAESPLASAPPPESAPPATSGSASEAELGSEPHVLPVSRPGPDLAAPTAAAATSDAASPAHRDLEPTLADLPQRVPAEPDVPGSGEPWRAIPPAAAPQLARIADQLRRDDVPPEGLSEGFDVDEVLAAVRGVDGVRAASLRASQTGAHTLRLDLADDADPVQVSGVVARLLQERMGLSAAPQHVPQQRGPQESVRGNDMASQWPAQPAAGPEPPTSPPFSSPKQGRQEQELRPGPLPAPPTGPRVVIEGVQVNVVGLDATVEVRLAAGRHRALGLASGPAIDSYVVRLAAVSAARAVDGLMREAGRTVVADDSPSRCFVEHTGLVPFGSTEVAVVVVLLVCGGWVEQLAGSAVVDGDARHAAVRATLGAVNRRLDALLA
jgi:hypothetical protein